MISDPVLGDEFAGDSPLAKPVFRLVEDKNKHIWFLSESRVYQAIPGSGGFYTIHSKPFLRLSTSQVNAIYPDADGKSLWFGNLNGLVRYDPSIKKSFGIDFSAFIREVSVNRTIPIFGGHGIDDDRGLTAVLDYDNRNLLFKCAAPFFEDESSAQYRYFLEDYNDHWTDWMSPSQKEYTNLNPGYYRLKVQAKNVYGIISPSALFQFRILVPWYLTWWAFLSYLFVFLSLTYLIFKWRRSIKLEKEKQRLEYEKQRLEQTVKERTSEINEKNQQLEKQTHQLQEQAGKLQEMDKVKSRFFANISHEFRTPLTLIMSPLEEMISDSRDKKQEDKIKLMLRNSRQLLTLINQLLELSRIDSGKMKLQVSGRDIISFIKGILSSFQVLIQHNQLELKFHSEEENILLYFDYQKMEEVMTNLLINSIKFTPPGGKITVSVRVTTEQTGESSLGPGFIEISVQDTGIGISIDQLPHIFDRFHQVEGALPRDHAHKGTGIGLALVKELVNLHRGKVNVSSTEDKGTTFTIQLPMGTAHLRPEEMVDPSIISLNDTNGNKPVIPMDLLPEEEDEDWTHPLTPGGEEDTKKDLEDETGQEEKNVILVVEDHEEVRKYIQISLKSSYTVEEAKNGKEGIEKAREIIPDLIISDVMMPEKDGCELCRELKNDIRTSHIPIILLTAKASEESIIKGLETGADDYITKPFNTRILLTRIKNLIDLRQQMQLKIQREKMLLPSKISVSSLDDQFLKKFQEIIEKNLDDTEFRIDVLCEKLGMGRSTLFRKIGALTGQTPNQFILSYRLERAAQILLKDKSRKITDVALDVGFETPAYFTKCFKDKFNQPPSSFQASESQPSTGKISSVASHLD
jgi:signal transduction histidine kinase/DNA-binding response OmpR family regulator